MTRFTFTFTFTCIGISHLLLGAGKLEQHLVCQRSRRHVDDPEMIELLGCKSASQQAVACVSRTNLSM